MQTTSHFVGISLDSAQFADMFIELQNYSIQHQLGTAMELQNVLSVHITLYYLEESLQEDQKAQLLADISTLSANKRAVVSGLQGKYFGEPGKERVGYIGCEPNETLKAINEFFARRYNRTEIPENLLAFVPHISLFRIQDAEAFAAHKVSIDSIISAGLEKIDEAGLLKGLHLYRVNSWFHPEIQIPVS